jgi:Glycosyltransferase
MSVVVFHPSVAPFVQQAARAIHEAGQLARFETALHDEPARWSQRLLVSAARLARRDLAPQFRRRAITEIPLELVRAHPWGEYARLAVGALDRDGRATDFVWEKTEHAFDRRVSRSIDRSLTGVYGFEHSSLATFRRARELGLRVAYDVPAPEAGFVHDLLAREMERFPELRTAYHHHTAQRESRRLARRHAEWRCADVVITASRFTRDSFTHAGLDTAKAHVVPYGAPPPASRDDALAKRDPASRLSLIWAGTFSIRKGAHHVLEAWRSGRFGRHATLRVFGAVTLPPRLLHPLPEGIELGGSIPRDELMQHYAQSDALLFPTLCDGFGMVATEAWSRGVPVLTTDRAGAADLLQPDVNGRLLAAGNPTAIPEAIEWCLAHRDALHAMREAAWQTAARWQWSDYRLELRRVLATAGLLS